MSDHSSEACAPAAPRQGQRKPTNDERPRWWKSAGPGLITGAADDDPSGIATFSSVGAQYGTQLVWTALFSWPLMAAVQMMCARVGMVTGTGLAAALKRKFSRTWVALAVVLLLVANVANIAADLAGMADALRLVVGGPTALWVGVIGLGISLLTVRLRYRTLARLLMALTLALLAYIVCAVLTRPNWSEVLHHLFVPTLPHGRDAWQAIVAILGTSISPYLFFWQAGQEVEEEKQQGRTTVAERVGASHNEIVQRRIDITVGTFASNVVMFFIIVAAAQALRNAPDPSAITTADAAMALKPLAGAYAPLLYALGIIGTGLLALPTLAGSAAYGVADALGWKCGLDQPFRRAKAFYSVFIAATLAGAALSIFQIDPIKALVWSAVLNGILAPPLLFALFLVASDKKLMYGQPSSLLTRSVVLLTSLLMGASVIVYFLA